MPSMLICNPRSMTVAAALIEVMDCTRSKIAIAVLLREGARPHADRRKGDPRNECPSVHHSITLSSRSLVEALQIAR
jgi:hypothetical protein